MSSGEVFHERLRRGSGPPAEHSLKMELTQARDLGERDKSRLLAIAAVEVAYDFFDALVAGHGIGFNDAVMPTTPDSCQICRKSARVRMKVEFISLRYECNVASA